jgi:hypothetical protein
MSGTAQHAPGTTRIDLQQHDLSAPGRCDAAELDTYVVEKGKPLITLAE